MAAANRPPPDRSLARSLARRPAPPRPSYASPAARATALTFLDFFFFFIVGSKPSSISPSAIAALARPPARPCALARAPSAGAAM